MSYLVLVNSKSGAVRDAGSNALKADLEAAFTRHKAAAEMRVLHPRELEDAIKDAISRASPPEAIIVGGGDGSISTGAALLANGDIPLGVLPLGTMNLLARALEIPLDPGEAVATLLRAKPVRIDLLDLNGRIVVLHASIGLQPQIIRVREMLPYQTRFTRIVNGAIAWFRVTRRLRPIHIIAEAESQSFDRWTVAALVSNNALREGVAEVPVAQDLTAGEIALYVARTRRRAGLVKLALATTLGVWRDSDLVEEFRTRSLEIDANKKRLVISIDGEVEKLQTPLTVTLKRKCLPVLKPSSA